MRCWRLMVVRRVPFSGVSRYGCIMGNRMRLAEFVLTNIEPILAEWEIFARSIWPDVLNHPATDPSTLRDHAEAILRTSAMEMMSNQTAAEQSEKSHGDGVATASGDRVDRASEKHGAERFVSGFELWAVISEYRALRASVIRLWRESGPDPDLHDLDDLTRFNECMDQSLTEAVRSYTEQVQRERDSLLGNEQAARREAEDANRAKDLFLATLSHEMRTPLNAIAGWVTLLRMSGRSETDFAEGLDVIERNTKAQVQLIEDVLDVSRIVSGKLRLEIRDSNLIEIINAGIDAVRPAADARAIVLDAQLDPRAAQTSCDKARIQQVIWNLLSNAIKFTPKGGTVSIRLSREGSDLRISVSDNGQGISPELLPHVFERFRQADNSTRRQYGGLGLGLSIVKHVTEMHGGTVEAQSAGEGRGATFIVCLPIKAVQIDDVDLDRMSEETGDGGPSDPSSGLPLLRLDGLRVLVVDDQVDARRMLAKVLESVGARVTTAANAADALVSLADAIEYDDGPDVLVSDVGMPERDGYDLIREIRRRGHLATELPAVALTAFAHNDDANKAALAGFQIHIPKPVNTQELTAVLSRLTGRTG
jgi:signal transduction histidine kinase/ActR/RegA family two-component response regulator